MGAWVRIRKEEDRGPLSLHNPATDIKTANKEIKNRHQLVVPYMVLEREAIAC